MKLLKFMGKLLFVLTKLFLSIMLFLSVIVGFIWTTSTYPWHTTAMVTGLIIILIRYIDVNKETTQFYWCEDLKEYKPVEKDQG